MSDRSAWKSVPFSVGDNVQKACLSFNDKLNRFIQCLRQIFLYGILCDIIYVTDFVRFRYIVGMAGEKDD